MILCYQTPDTLGVFLMDYSCENILKNTLKIVDSDAYELLKTMESIPSFWLLYFMISSILILVTFHETFLCKKRCLAPFKRSSN